MSDERMDERLRDYAARWTAARPAPSVSSPVSPSELPAAGRRDRRGWWGPYAAAASVVAVVAGVTVTVSSRDVRQPAAPPSPSPSPAPSYDECGEEDVRTRLTFARTAGGSSRGELRMWATGEPCTLRETPVVRMTGDNRTDLGVGYEFASEEGPYVVEATPRVLDLTWSAPFCPEPTSILVGIVVLSDEVASKNPLDKAVAPPCDRKSDVPLSVLTARWRVGATPTT